LERERERERERVEWGEGREGGGGIFGGSVIVYLLGLTFILGG